MSRIQLLKKLLATSVFFHLAAFGFAQVTEEWAAIYDRAGNVDESFAIAFDDAKNVYVTGMSLEGPRTDMVYADYITIKYNESGAVQWARRYNGTANGYDVARAIAVDKFGNVYVTGSSEAAYPGGGFHQDFVTVKYNSAGIVQWTARYNGPGNDDDGAIAIALDNSGNVYVCGSSEGVGTTYDYATVKYNSAGVQQWVARYSGPGNRLDIPYSMAVDGSGNVYVTGESAGVGGNVDYATVKYKPTGVQQWARRYNGPLNGRDEGKQVKVDASGNVFVTGASEGIASDYDYATLKYNSGGVQQWVARYNGPANGADYGNSLSVDNAGNVYVTGSSQGVGSGADYATLKYNAGGVFMWVSRYNGSDNLHDTGISLVLDNSANVYVVGISDRTASLWDIVTIKYNSFGTNLWLALYNGPANRNDEPRALAVDRYGFVYITGTTDRYSASANYLTIKYSQPGAIVARPAPVKQALNLSENFTVSGYPNPAIASATIQYEIPIDGRVEIKLFDLAGREVAMPINVERSAGHYSEILDVSSYPPGVYYLRATLKGKERMYTRSTAILVGNRTTR